MSVGKPSPYLLRETEADTGSVLICDVGPGLAPALEFLHSPLSPLAELVFTHILGWTQGAEDRGGTAIGARISHSALLGELVVQ